MVSLSYTSIVYLHAEFNICRSFTRILTAVIAVDFQRSIDSLQFHVGLKFSDIVSKC